MNNTKFSWIALVILIILIVGGYFAWTYMATPPTSVIPEGVVCTMDAKMCPDGSYVGRQGPNCEFAACPGY